MAVAIYRCPGDRIDYTPGADVTAGDVVDLGSMVGIATGAIPANTLGSLAIEGIFEGNKFSGEAISRGVKVYWDAGTSTFTGTVGYSEATAGVCVKDAASGDSTVWFKLIPIGT